MRLAWKPSRAHSRPPPSCSEAATRTGSTPCATAWPESRTREASSWPRCWREPPSKGRTASGWTCAPGRGAKRRHSPRSPPTAAPGSTRTNPEADAVEPWSDIVDLRLGDGRDLGSQEPDRYDRILVDAPCTGLGALRRRPEARWRKDPGDVPPLARLQGELLASAFGALRPGGALVYSTCTPVVEETRSVVSSFVQATERARLLDAGSIASAVAVREVAGYDGCVQLWPDADETDGMFLAVLAKE